jgi:hypothetical protein
MMAVAFNDISPLTTEKNNGGDMKECLACNRDIPEHASTCPLCGVILAKWRPRPPRIQPQPPTAAEPWFADAALSKAMAAPQLAIPQTASKPALNRAMVVAAIAISLLMLSAGAYALLAPLRKLVLPVPNTVAKPSNASTDPIYDPLSDFDLSIPLDSDPIGIACNAGEFVIGNRATPWGFVRGKWNGEEKWGFEKVPVAESVYNQKIAIQTVAWNGTQYIGYCDGAYFGNTHKNVFTVHDAKTLQLLKTYPAPELIGGLVWDGKGYWAGTRRNTENSGEPAYLYRLDENFNVVGKSSPPHVGCQGLAWDGKYLWWVDVFSDRIYLLTSDRGQVTTVHSYETRFGYLSGVGYDGKNIWVTEYDNKQLHRLNPTLLAAWSRGDFKTSQYAAFQGGEANPATSAPPPADPAAVAQLLRKLREDSFSTRATAEELIKLGAKEQAIEVLREMVKDSDQSVRIRALSTLRDLGAPINYDRYSRSSPISSDDAEVVDAVAELRSDTLYGSWKIHFGSELFSGNASRQEGIITIPIFAKYRISVSGGSLTRSVVKEYEASEGINERRDQELASGLGPGKYKIEIFIHAQYVDRAGTNKILNSSMPSLEVEK